MLGRTSRATPEEKEQKFQVKNYIVHERYDSENYNNDIGKDFFLMGCDLLKLDVSQVVILVLFPTPLLSFAAVELRHRRLCY